MAETPRVPPPKPVAQAGAPDASKVMTLFVAIVVTLYFGKEVLVPVTLALLLAFVLAPVVGLLRRLHFGRVPSVLLGVILALGVILGIGGVIGSQVADLAAQLPKYAATVEVKVSGVRTYTIRRLAGLADGIGSKESYVAAQPGATAAVAMPSKVAHPGAAPTPSYSAEPTDMSPLTLVESYIWPVLAPFATLGIVFVVAVFALLQQEDLRERLIRLIGSDDLHRTTLAIDDGGRRLSRYFLTQLSINALFGIVVGLGLSLIGVPYPVLWGILSALLRFVPYLGSLISGVLPMALAAAVEPGWSMVVWTAGLYVLIESITGQIIEPMVYGHSTGLSPFAVIVAAIFWSWLWGPIGLILSTPLTLCLVVLGCHVRRLEFLDVMLGDRPVLTPVESFYQRVLAGDADEVQDHAELMLRERSLSTYYDEVALNGLQLAANDAQRGTLDQDQLERVKRTITLLVRGLQGYEDIQPPPSNAKEEVLAPPSDEEELAIKHLPGTVDAGKVDLPGRWRDPSAILCIAGRGALDEAAAAMLAQLLGKHGMGARVVGYEEVSREHIDTFDVSGAAMACVSYLEISGNPAHLRYLMLRLRQRLPPGTPILVGRWPVDDAALKGERTRAAVGADYFTSSLKQAVTSCAEAAHAPASHPVAKTLSSSRTWAY